MKSTLSIGAVGHATSLFFAISFVLCVVVGLIVPGTQHGASVATAAERLSLD